MTQLAVVPLSFHWMFWYKDFCSNDKNWRLNIQQLFEVSTAMQFIDAYSKIKLPCALPLGSSYYFFKKGIQPVWEEEPNRGAGAWKILISNQMNNDMNFVWSDLLFILISDGFKELSCYVCGLTCNARRGTHKISLWTVKTTPTNFECIMKVGKILQTVIQNVYGIKSIKYKLHENSSNGFKYVL